MPLPRIAITMGDPAGVGPEICLRLLAHPGIRSECIPVVMGDAEVLSRAAQACQLPSPAKVWTRAEWEASSHPPADLEVVDLKALEPDGFRPGTVSAATGRAAYTYLETAIADALQGKVQAITTGPLHKEALRAAGFSYPGHTEILADKTGSPRFCMMLTSPELTCSFVTVHVGYHEVPGLISADRIREVITLTGQAMTRLRGRVPKMVVCGLNPHAGEHGLFGRQEEERLIEPAIQAARQDGWDVEGPLPPDTAFLAGRRRTTDAFICMYHDQGHIPLKALAFEEAVNVTLGLPIIRTSVDHGTALDIAWQGQANPSSLLQATRLAARLAREPFP